MTTQEFSIEFDILYNNLASNAAPPLNEYEKSVFLTKAQSDIVLELYSGRNNLGLAFESSEEVRRYLLPLIKYYDRTEAIVSSYDEIHKCYKHYIYRPVDSTESWNVLRPGLATIREELYAFTKDNKEVTIPIVPVPHDSLEKVLRNPFKRPNTFKRALRVDSNQADRPGNINGSTTIIYSELPIRSLIYREWYLAKPSPIILEDTYINDSSITIDGEPANTAKECMLTPVLHRLILDRAVLYAKQAYVGGQAQRAQQE